MTRNEHERIVCTLFGECLEQARKESLIDRGQCLRLYGSFLEYLSHEGTAFLSTLCAMQSAGIEPMAAQTILTEAIRLDVSRYLDFRWPLLSNEYASTFLAIAVSSIVEVFLGYAEECDDPKAKVAMAYAAITEASVLHTPCSK